jgi:predicted 3-demethylubiquinone-9 3-methyltransferase (glyoxalase superfamily)
MPDITPFLWFDAGAEDAAAYYVSVFPNSKITQVTHYGEVGPGPAGSVMTVEFELDGREMMAINAPGGSSEPMTEFGQGKVALFVSCATQAEVNTLWDKLSAGGEEMPCGWVQDRYGFAWNIVPHGLSDVLGGPDPERAQRALRAMFWMKKIDINELRRVYDA